jgi:hydrogenase nickel incorporation protein HypA/HybF
MHETGIVRDLVRRLEQAAREAGAERVSGAAVWLGALSHFSPAHFREHFEEDARGTLAEGAALDIEISDDLAHPDAQHVMLRSIDLEVADEKGDMS